MCAVGAEGKEQTMVGPLCQFSPFLLHFQFYLACRLLSVYSGHPAKIQKEKDVFITYIWVFLTCEIRRTHSLHSRQGCPWLCTWVFPCTPWNLYKGSSHCVIQKGIGWKMKARFSFFVVLACFMSTVFYSNRVLVAFNITWTFFSRISILSM